MVARHLCGHGRATTTREATSLATATRLEEHGLDLYAVSSHPHAADECSPYDGRTFARPGSRAAREGRYPVLEVLPPFHPRCRHVLCPSFASFDRYLEELERAVDEGVTLPEPEALPAPARATTTFYRPAQAPSSPPPARAELIDDGTPRDSPFGNRVAVPSVDDETYERLASQRSAYLLDGDPGPEPGAGDAWLRHVETDARRQVRALNVSLGPEMSKELDRAWAKRERIKARILDGELTIEEASELAEEEWRGREERRLAREWRDVQRERLELQRSCNCFICGSFKRRPSDVCNRCGDDPVTYSKGGRYESGRENDEAVAEFNRAYGWGN